MGWLFSVGDEEVAGGTSSVAAFRRGHLGWVVSRGWTGCWML